MYNTPYNASESACAPDGKWAVADSYGHLFWYDSRLSSLGHSKAKGAVAKLLFSPNSRYLAARDVEGRVNFYDANTHQLQSINSPGDNPPLAFSTDSALLANAASWNRLRVWRTATQELVQTVETGNTTLRALAFSRDGMWLLAIAGNGKIIKWRVARSAVPQTR
jgi:WD40 repeat protein